MPIKLSSKDWKEVGFPGTLTVWDGQGRVVDRLLVGSINLPMLASMRAEGRRPEDLRDHDLIVKGTRLFDRDVTVVRNNVPVARYRLVFDQRRMVLLIAP